MVDALHDRRIEFWYAVGVVRRCPRALVVLAPKYRTHPRVMATAVAQDPFMVKCVPATRLKDVLELIPRAQTLKTFKLARKCDHLRTECDTCSVASLVVSRDGAAFQLVGDAARDDADIARKAVDQFPNAFKWASARLRADRPFVLHAVAAGAPLPHASTSLRGDRDIVMAAIAKHSNPKQCFMVASAALRKDRAVLRAAMEAHREKSSYWSGTPFRYASSGLKHDHDVVLEMIALAPDAVYGYLPPRLRCDVDVVVRALRHGLHTAYLDDELLSDDAAMERIVCQEGRALAVASKALTRRRDVVARAVATHGNALKHASSELRADGDIVRAAVAQSGDAIQHAEGEWGRDRAMVTLAAKTAHQPLMLGDDHLALLTVQAAMLQSPMNIRDRPFLLKKIAHIARAFADDVLSVDDAQECSDLLAELASKTPHDWTDVTSAIETFVARVHAPGGAVANAHKRAYEEAFGAHA